MSPAQAGRRGLSREWGHQRRKRIPKGQRRVGHFPNWDKSTSERGYGSWPVRMGTASRRLGPVRAELSAHFPEGDVAESGRYVASCEVMGYVVRLRGSSHDTSLFSFSGWVEVDVGRAPATLAGLTTQTLEVEDGACRRARDYCCTRAVRKTRSTCVSRRRQPARGEQV